MTVRAYENQQGICQICGIKGMVDRIIFDGGFDRGFNVTLCNICEYDVLDSLKEIIQNKELHNHLEARFQSGYYHTLSMIQ